jgi:hypothetical protein
MKPRHAAALALVGWYLLAPVVYKPANSDSATSPYKPFTDLGAPLSTWTNYGAFDSASDCNSERERRIARADKDATLPTKTDAAVAVIESWQHMECVSTDDPRLEEK